MSSRPRVIGVDGGSWSNRRGYGRFLRELLPALLRHAPQHRFVLFLDREREIDAHPNLKIVSAETRSSVDESAVADGNRSAVDLARMSVLVGKHKLNLMFFPTVYSYFPVAPRFPIVTAIHDAIADRNPRFAFSGKKQELLWRTKVRMAIAQSARIVTVSEHSRAAIAEFFRIRPDKFIVIPEGAASIFRPTNILPPEHPFLLAVGGISPNKNLATLLQAYSALPRTGLRLVIAGDYERDGFQSCYEELKRLTAELHLEDRVHFTGYVSDQRLCELYNQAAVFVMPSYDEGFGLPLLEAMSCGAVCVVSRGTALEEVGGGAVLLADPARVETWVAQIEAALHSPQLRAAAIERARCYSWDGAAITLLEAWAGLLRPA